MQGQAGLQEAHTAPVKGKIRYGFALKFCRARLEGESVTPITMKHPVVLEAAHRYRLQLPQLRRLVADLRKERDGRG